MRDPTFLVWRQAWIRLWHWEFWPSWLINLPAYLYWIWLAARARSLFFFNTANPHIANGGFLMDSKVEIYDQLPEDWYPETLLVAPGTPLIQVKEMMADLGLMLPVIGKPDIGLQGRQVAVLSTAAAVENYVRTMQVPFLIQELVSYPQEVGIFYCRLPHESQGRITGIVGKTMLSVLGDGRRTIRELVLDQPRALLQWKHLKKSFGAAFHEVVPAGKRLVLVPYGNHCRGSLFEDWTARADEALASTIDRICQTMPEFHYGRLDIRFRSWEALSRGQDFSIIEVNGAGSEPTHIYDPRHGLWFAWTVVLRHLGWLHRISVHNRARLGLSFMTTRQGLDMLAANRRHMQLLSGQSNAHALNQGFAGSRWRVLPRQPALRRA